MACAAIERHGAVLAQGVLVTVHDLYGGAIPLRLLETYLRVVCGYDVQPFRYRPRAQDLAASGKELSHVLKYQKPHTMDEAVHFVTHGYGALVLREAFRSVDWDHTKSKVVMLAPPNRGLQYFKAMRKNIGVAGYGGVAAEELAKLSADELDQRLGKLPRRCYPLVLAGNFCLNPFNQHNYPNDGLVKVNETELPGEFRQQIIGAPHYLLPSHPTTIELTQSFLGA